MHWNSIDFNLTLLANFNLPSPLEKKVSGLSFEMDWFTQKKGTKVMIQHRNSSNMAKTDSCFDKVSKDELGKSCGNPILAWP